MMQKLFSTIITPLLLMTYLVSCTPTELEIRMIPPPEKILENQTPNLLTSALNNFYGHYSVGKIDYANAMKIFNLLYKSEERQQGIIAYYLGIAKLQGLNSSEVDFAAANYYFATAAEKLRSDLDDTNGNRSLVLALMYRDGYGVKKTSEKVLPLLLEAERKGNDFAPLIMAEFLLKSSSEATVVELAKKQLFKAMQYDFPHAYYLAYRYFPNLESEANLIKSAEKYCIEAMMDAAERNGNKFAVQSAVQKAMEMGSGEAYYKSSHLVNSDMERIYLLKQAALRGNCDATSELAQYYESQKLWGKAIVYNLFAMNNTNDNVEPKLALERLDNISGLNIVLKEIWKNRHYAELNLLDSDIGFYINSFQNKSATLRADYTKYLSRNADKAFMNCDYYYIYQNNMPMELAGDIFRYYRKFAEPSNTDVEWENNYFIAYAIAAGLAGQGELQSAALDKVKNYALNSDMELAVKLLKLNSYALQDKKQEFSKLAETLQIADNQKIFAVNFINGCALSLLNYREFLADLFKINPDNLLEAKPIKKQPFFNFRNGKDIVNMMFEEPEL
ncbi:MAG: hypothetical protein IJW31_02465 [Lentisphaeria bacterium]|nr:hypothetical protein [Lentisphaeria bacterium]